MPNRTRCAGLVFFVLAGVLLMLAGCADKPVAVVNGHRITEKQFVGKMEELAGKQVLQEMVDRQIVEDAFTKAGLKVTPEDAAKQIQEMQGQFPTPEAFTEYLKSRGTTLEELQKNVEFSLKVEMVATKDVKPTEAQLQEFFNTNGKRYNKPLRVTIKEIVVPGKKVADQVLAALGQQGASFTAVANQFSISPVTRQSGGQRPETPVDQLFPLELRVPAQTAKLGQVVGPIETDQGWYVIQVDSRKAPEAATFAQVRDQVAKDYGRANMVPVDQLLKKLRQEALVKIVAPQYSEMNNLYVGAQELPKFGEEQKPAQPGAQPIPPPSAAPSPAPAGSN